MEEVFSSSSSSVAPATEEVFSYSSSSVAPAAGGAGGGSSSASGSEMVQPKLVFTADDDEMARITNISNLEDLIESGKKSLGTDNENILNLISLKADLESNDNSVIKDLNAAIENLQKILFDKMQKGGRRRVRRSRRVRHRSRRVRHRSRRVRRRRATRRKDL